MATIIGGIATTHVPAIGNAIARGLQGEPYWKPFFDGFKAAHTWINANRPDAVVVIYNDHGLNFFLDKLPTFAVGAAIEYRHADEGWGLPISRPFAGDPALSWHIIESLVADEDTAELRLRIDETRDRIRRRAKDGLEADTEAE